MFDLGWTEMLLIGIVALIVVGPKDLPGLFRNVGRFMGKARGMAREFSRAMESAADEAGVKEVEKTLRAAANPKAFGAQKLQDATKSINAAVTGTPGGEVEKLSAERQAAKAKFTEKAAEIAQARQAREAAAAAEAAAPEAAPPPPAAAPAETSATPPPPTAPGKSES